MTVQELAARLGAEFTGDGTREIDQVAPLESAGPRDISFVASLKFAKLAVDSPAGCLIVPPSHAIPGRTLILALDPREAFARAISILVPVPRPPAGVHASAVVDGTAQIHPTASLGPFTAVGAHCRIGAHCVLHAHVTLYPHVTLGDRVVLHAGVVLGADGFGFVWRDDHYENFPQVGRVEIGDDVEIGAHSCVDRAALGVTSIGAGTKLDNMVHVGHNCRIGRHVVIAAQTGLAGGVVIEDRAVIGGQVGLGDRARVEAGAIIGSGAGVLTAKVVRAGEPQWGTPARPLKQYLRQLATLSSLSRRKR
jgi:UDP-3-O-[3-hydroxymyristoyl] glucosamine N-acyltransferase